MEEGDTFRWELGVDASPMLLVGLHDFFAEAEDEGTLLAGDVITQIPQTSQHGGRREAKGEWVFGRNERTKEVAWYPIEFCVRLIKRISHSQRSSFGKEDDECCVREEVLCGLYEGVSGVYQEESERLRQEIYSLEEHIAFEQHKTSHKGSSLVVPVRDRTDLSIIWDTESGEGVSADLRAVTVVDRFEGDHCSDVEGSTTTYLYFSKGEYLRVRFQDGYSMYSPFLFPLFASRSWFLFFRSLFFHTKVFLFKKRNGVLRIGKARETLRALGGYIVQIFELCQARRKRRRKNEKRKK